MSVDSNIEPLLIVRDDDDDDDIEEIDSLDTTEISTLLNQDHSYLYESPLLPKTFSVSYVALDAITDILAISRFDSIFYCLEDVYSKMFENICTYEQFLDYLAEDDQLLIKQTTLSENVAINEHNPNLKIYNPVRYRLISIDTSDYLIQLKQYLIDHQLNDVYQRFETFIQKSKDNTSMPMIVDVEENVHMTEQSETTFNTQSTILRNLLSQPSPTNISFSEAIYDSKHSNFEDLPKLVIRHQKVFSTRTIDTLGELFPTWFVHPTYRCIHCFTCDKVYTPRMFMLHVDDKQLVNEKLMKISSIELLTSERISEQKVELWNKFCSNLKLHAKEGHIDGFKDFLID